MRTRPIRETIAPKLLPHLFQPIDAYTLAERVGTTFTGCEPALRAMHRRGMVRKIVRRKGGEFIAHLWVAA